METEVPEKQLFSQILEAIRVTPTLHEDLQVEVMKVRARLNPHPQCAGSQMSALSEVVCGENV